MTGFGKGTGERGKNSRGIDSESRGISCRNREIDRGIVGLDRLPSVDTRIIDSDTASSQIYDPHEVNDSQTEDGFVDAAFDIGIIILGGFAIGRSVLKPSHESFLTSFVADEQSLINQDSGGAQIESVIGYTDAIGPGELNRSLRLDRANAVAQYLVTNLKIPAELIGQVKGAPSDEFLDKNDTAIQRQRNRSVIIYFRPSKIKIADKLEAMQELHSSLQRRKNLNDERIKILTNESEKPKTPGEKFRDKSFFEFALEFFFIIKGFGDPSEPTGGTLAEALTYEFEEKYHEQNIAKWEDEIAYLEHENKLIGASQSELSRVIYNLRRGRDISTKETETKIKNLLALAYRDFAPR